MTYVDGMPLGHVRIESCIAQSSSRLKLRNRGPPALSPYMAMGGAAKNFQRSVDRVPNGAPLHPLEFSRGCTTATHRGTSVRAFHSILHHPELALYTILVFDVVAPIPTFLERAAQRCYALSCDRGTATRTGTRRRSSATSSLWSRLFSGMDTLACV